MSARFGWRVPLVHRPEGAHEIEALEEGGLATRQTLRATFFQIAVTASHRSTCPVGRRHGAVIVVGKHVVAMGYNGPPQGWRACDGCDIPKDELGKDFRSCPAVHAEANALLHAARFGVRVEGGVMYCTKAPCHACRLLIENVGLLRVEHLEE